MNSPTIKLSPTNINYHQHKALDNVTHQAKLSSIGDNYINDAVHLPPSEELPQPGLNDVPIQPGGNKQKKIFSIKYKKNTKNIKANNFIDAAKKFNENIIKNQNKNIQVTLLISKNNITKKFRIKNTLIKHPKYKYNYSIQQI